MYPSITVVIPARNAADTIDAQLSALAGQGYPGTVEVIVVDNASEDRTAERARNWAREIPGLRIVEARGGQSVARARNAGFTAASHELVLVCDADDVVGRSWIAKMVEALCDSDIVGGGTIDWDGGRLPTGEPEAFGHGGFGFLPSFGGCNFGVRRIVWEQIGGFDEQLLSSEDIDFAWRAQLQGFRYVARPDAFVYYRVSQLRWVTFRKWLHHGTYQPALYARFRDAGLQRQSVHRALARWVILLFTSYRVFGSSAMQARWCREAGRRLGRLAGSVRFRTLYL